MTDEIAQLREQLRATERECEILRSLTDGSASRSRVIVGVSQAAYNRLKAENVELRQQIEDATGPHCSGCGNAIDPECCWCGDAPASHRWDDSHGFVPMGCDCSRADQDWKKLASALREQLWRERKAGR